MNNSRNMSRSRPGLAAFSSHRHRGPRAHVFVPMLLGNSDALGLAWCPCCFQSPPVLVNFEIGMGPELTRYTWRLSALPGNQERVRRLVGTALLIQAGVGILTTTYRDLPAPGSAFVVSNFIWPNSEKVFASALEHSE